MNWQVSWWFGLIVRIAVTAFSAWLLIRLLREKITVARVNTAVAWVLALGVFWLANIEGATRLVFLGFEIDRRVENAQTILNRLKEVENSAENTKYNLITVQEKASQTATELKHLIEQENKKYEIQRLQNMALDGDVGAYETLKNYPSDDQELAERAKAAVLAIKGFYIGKTKIKGLKLHRTKENGSRVQEDELETSWLLQDLQRNPHWRIRARAAQLLAERKESGVPEALLRSMENDINLWVRKEALDSFEKVTEFKASDVFQFETGSPRRWYEMNKEKVQSQLKKQDNN